MQKVRKNRFYWHGHHQYLLDLVGPNGFMKSSRERKEWIVYYKPSNEVPTRLRRFRAVKGNLPDKFVRAVGKKVKALVARRHYSNIRYHNRIHDTDLSKIAARTYTTNVILKLHRRECKDCSWTSALRGGLYGKLHFPALRYDY